LKVELGPYIGGRISTINGGGGVGVRKEKKINGFGAKNIDSRQCRGGGAKTGE